MDIIVMIFLDNEPAIDNTNESTADNMTTNTNENRFEIQTSEYLHMMLI